jgi:spermidine/putrescine transport system ATP-binding protein
VHVTHDQEEAMTMADTIGVMNAGRIEQLGTPVDLYESPVSAYVANFLGQSNLLRATVTDRSGDEVGFEVAGRRLTMPAARCRTASRRLLAGVRPEKIHIAGPGGSGRPGAPADGVRPNVLAGGVVSDASFTGVSTQYLVRLPWGQELMVFAQNLGVGDVLPVGEQVTLSWEPAHTFGLDGSEDATAGVEAVDELPALRAAPEGIGT